MPRKPEYKPLLYTTTIRNPERFKDFMHILKRFNGRILNNKTVELFERELFKVGLYRPMKRPETVQDKWKSTKNGELASKPLTDEETKDVYQQNDPQVNKSIKGHQEAGFPKGWPSRFDTQFKLMKVLGFVYYEWGKPINFSQTGNYLADTVSIEIDSGAISREIVNPQNEQIAFMQAFAKQQRCNPFICELNDNIPLILLLEVIKKLNSDPDYNGSGISYKEIPLVIFWKDNDAESLYQRIKLLRKEHRYNPSNEVIEDICVNEILGGFKKFDLDSIVSEYPDEFVRKMRMTGLISFRGGGRFIDINHNEDDKINYILANYATYRKYTSKEEYFDYMSDIDDALFALKAVEIPKNVAADKLAKLVGDYSWDSIKKELTHLAKKTSSSHNILRFIAAPARLEFLTALAIKSKLPAVEVIPNYPCDDEGLPKNNIRILLVNNGEGIEFKNYLHPAFKFGDAANEYFAARGHFGAQSPRLVRDFAGALGFEYRASTDKKSFLENIDWFTSCKLTDKPLVWEAFTNEVDENASILYMNTLNESAKGIAKRIAKAILPESVQRKITEHIGRTK